MSNQPDLADSGISTVPGGNVLEDRGTPPPSVPWSKRELVAVGVSGLASMFVLTFALTAALAVLQSRLSAPLPKQVTGAITLIGELGLLLPVWWFGLRRHGLGWSSVGFRPFSMVRGLVLGCAAWALAMTGTVIWSLVLSLFNLRTQPNMLPLFGGGIGGLVAALLAGGLVGPFAEEVFFRGYLFAGMRQHLGLKWALLLNGLIFALIHILPTSYPPIFLLGVLFAGLLELTGSLWPAILVHSFINSLSFLLLYVGERLAL